MNNKILVTGAGGYIGRHVVKSALDHGFTVIASDFSSDQVDSRAIFTDEPIFSGAPNLFEKLGSPDILIHMAWKDGFVHNSPFHMMELSKHVAFLNYMADQNMKNIAIMGSMHEIGYWEGKIEETTPCNPLTQYGIAKNALRQSFLLYAKEKPVHPRWLRAFYIYGDDTKGSSIFAKLQQKAAENEQFFPFTSGKNQYDFISIKELAEQIVAASVQEEIDGIINVCSGKPVSLAEQVEWYIQDQNLNIQLQYNAFPDREYDSPCTFGDAEKIQHIMKNIRW